MDYIDDDIDGDAAVVDTLVHQATNSVLGVVIENKEGRGIVLADRVVDCTGDGDVAYQAGCRYTTLPLEEVGEPPPACLLSLEYTHLLSVASHLLMLSLLYPFALL